MTTTLKKWTAALLAALMTVTLTACGQRQPTEASAPAPTSSVFVSEPSMPVSEPSASVSESSVPVSEPSAPVSEPSALVSEVSAAPPVKPDLSDPDTIQYIKDAIAQEAAQHDGTIQLKTWSASGDRDFEKSLMEAFTEQFADSRYTITIKALTKGEADAAGQAIESPKKAADVFSFMSEHLEILHQAHILAEVLPFYAANVREDNRADSVTASSYDDKLYAFPKGANYGYFMYYDKRVFDENDVSDMDTMIQKAAQADKNVFLSMGNLWYECAFFFAADWELSYENNTQIAPTFPKDEQKMLSAARAMRHIVQQDKGFIGTPGPIGENAFIDQGFRDGSMAAAVTGTWMGESIRDAIGAENVGAAKLPTVLMDGEQKQLYSFDSQILLGVNTASQYPFTAQTLAYYLTNEENQLRRHTARGMMPTNLAAAQSQQVLSDPACQAIEDQRPYSYPQGNSVGGVFWSSSVAQIGAYILQGEGNLTDEELLAYYEKTASYW